MVTSRRMLAVLSLATLLIPARAGATPSGGVGGAVPPEKIVAMYDSAYESAFHQ